MIVCVNSKSIISLALLTIVDYQVCINEYLFHVKHHTGCFIEKCVNVEYPMVVVFWLH